MSSGTTVADIPIGGARALVARTGYTGEPLGFEVLLHPQAAGAFWRAALEAGAPLGTLSAGLGARDSTRIEAGLPLFGHEIEGDLGLSMHEAGYGHTAGPDNRSFIGGAAYSKRVAHPRRHVLRLCGRGRKTIRPGHVILDDAGHAVGQVTSFAYVHADMSFVVLAAADGRFQPKPGETVRGLRTPMARFDGQVEPRSVVDLSGMPRFPPPDERARWPARYA